MIGVDEVSRHAAHFGVPQSQIIRDHLISHAILAIAQRTASPDSVTFFGGTALCRTWLPSLRLSEDIDLLVDAKSAADSIMKHVSRQLRREFPEHQWHPVTSEHAVDTWTLVSGQTAIKVQFVQRPEWQAVPTTETAVELRYDDLPGTTIMTVPTPAGFAAMKLMAWFDRKAPRDLFDLAAQAEARHIDTTALQLVRKVAGHWPTPTSLGINVPKSVESTWQQELEHQLTTNRTATDCFAILRSALGELVAHDEGQA